MLRYIALLRGVNVGGNTMIKMQELRAMFEALAFENVTSYINSGNIGFNSAPRDQNELVDLIEYAIEGRFGRRSQLMVRERSKIAEIIERNPFAGQFESHKEMHVLFLKEPMDPKRAGELYAAALPGERYHVSGREIYAHLPTGVADSLLGSAFIEKKLKTTYTARNWRTVERLASL